MVPSASDAFTSCPVFRMFLYQGWCDLQHLPLLPPFFFNSFAAAQPRACNACIPFRFCCVQTRHTYMYVGTACCMRPPWLNQGHEHVEPHFL